MSHDQSSPFTPAVLQMLIRQGQNAEEIVHIHAEASPEARVCAAVIKGFLREKAALAQAHLTLLEELKLAVIVLECRDGEGHYCPNCDNSLYNVRQRLRYLVKGADR